MVVNLRNNEPPIGWKICALPDFSHIVMGQSPPSDTYNYESDGLPFFQGKAEFGDTYPQIDKYCSRPNKIANYGATLLSVRAPVGPTNLANQDFCIGRGLAAIHPYCGIEPKFILFLFRSIEPDISGKGTGSTFKAVTKAFVEELKFALPPLNEQHRIVAKIEELFSELDKGIESLKTARQQLKIYRQAVLKHAFEGSSGEKRTRANSKPLSSFLRAYRKNVKSTIRNNLKNGKVLLQCGRKMEKGIRDHRSQKPLYPLMMQPSVGGNILKAGYICHLSF